MKKPAWISLFGWAGLFLVATCLTIVVLETVMHYDRNISAFGGLCFLASFPMFFMWAAGSIWHAMVRAKARRNADAVAHAIAAAKAAAVQQIRKTG